PLGSKLRHIGRIDLLQVAVTPPEAVLAVSSPAIGILLVRRGGKKCRSDQNQPAQAQSTPCDLLHFASPRRVARYASMSSIFDALKESLYDGIIDLNSRVMDVTSLVMYE